MVLTRRDYYNGCLFHMEINRLHLIFAKAGLAFFNFNGDSNFISLPPFKTIGLNNIPVNSFIKKKRFLDFGKIFLVKSPKMKLGKKNETSPRNYDMV